MNKPSIDPSAPNGPFRLMVRSLEIIKGLAAQGVDPIHDPTDLLLVSLLPLAIKQIIAGDAFVDAPMLEEVLQRLDLTELTTYIRERKH